MALNLSLTRLKTGLYNVTVTNGDGSALDLTGMTLYFHAAGVVEIDKSSPSDGITITSAAAGLAQLQIDPADTEDVPADGNFGLSCELTLVNGSNYYPLNSGNLHISPNVGTP